MKNKTFHSKILLLQIRLTIINIQYYKLWVINIQILKFQIVHYCKVFKYSYIIQWVPYFVYESCLADKRRKMVTTKTLFKIDSTGCLINTRL